MIADAPSAESNARPEADGGTAVKATLYTVAAKLFHERGYHATSMSRLAKAMKITKSSLYYYISGKEDLLYGIMDQSLTWVEQTVITPARRLSDPEQRLRFIIETHGLRLLGVERAIPLLIDQDAALSPERRQNIWQRKQTYIELVRSTLEELRTQGRLREVSSDVATFSVFAMLLAIPQRYMPDTPLPVNRALHEISSVLLDGLLVQSKNPSSDLPSGS